MKNFFALTFVVLCWTVCANAQAPWLDAKVVKQWNKAGQTLPHVPKSEFAEVNDNCKGMLRPATLPVDKIVAGAGWYLLSAAQVYGDLTMLEGAGGFDGNCRPMDYNAFVFRGDKYLGSLSPTNMQSREDGSLSDFQLWDDHVSVTFLRYRKSDPFCCPSRTSTLFLNIVGDTLKPDSVTTEKMPR